MKKLIHIIKKNNYNSTPHNFLFFYKKIERGNVNDG